MNNQQLQQLLKFAGDVRLIEENGLADEAFPAKYSFRQTSD
jgi:hypothetical protein